MLKCDIAMADCSEWFTHTQWACLNAMQVQIWNFKGTALFCKREIAQERDSTFFTCLIVVASNFNTISLKSQVSCPLWVYSFRKQHDPRLIHAWTIFYGYILEVLKYIWHSFFFKFLQEIVSFSQLLIYVWKELNQVFTSIPSHLGSVWIVSTLNRVWLGASLNCAWTVFGCCPGTVSLPR